MERRLSAIIAADAVNFSGRMREDEAAALTAVKSCVEEIFEPVIASHNGRIVKLIGDGLLAEFASAVEAVSCAAEVQENLDARNAGLTADTCFRYRIGVNLGDIIVDGGDIFGDGVNIASRLESIAEPGGVAISASVYDQVRAKVDLSFEDLGEKELKNIPDPIRVYRLTSNVGDLTETIAKPPTTVVAGPRKPVIAVLPFDNMSTDPEQEYFADGMTEDIITELSRFQSIDVIARNSVFTYKGKAVKVQDVASELGANYALEGSVRKAGNRVRLTVQLIDCENGNHIWAERYDRELVDIFDLQDELTQTVVAALPSRIENANQERIKRKQATDFDVYDRLIKAKLLHHRASSDANEEGLRLLDQAIEMDPDFAAAHGWKACTMGQAMAHGWLPYDDEMIGKVYGEVQKGLALDENDVECVRVLAEFHMEMRALDDALLTNEKALRLTPNDPRILAQRGEFLAWYGKPEEGVDWIEKAMRLDPHGADGFAHLLGRALYGAGRYEDALASFKRVPALRLQHHVFITAIRTKLGHTAEAQAAAKTVLQADGDFSASAYSETLFYAHDEDRAALRDTLIQAGLPA